MAQQPLVSQGLLIIEASRSHSDTPHLDECPAQRRGFYLTTHNIHKRQDIHAPGGIRARYPSKRTAADPRLRPRGHWDRQQLTYTVPKLSANKYPFLSKFQIQ